MKPKFLKLWLAVSALLLAPSIYAHDCVVGGVYYNLYSSSLTATVTEPGSSSSSYSGDVVIPETISYSGKEYRVTSIVSYAFRGCSGLTSIEIPNSVTSIGNYAFNGCTSLSKVIFADGSTTLSLGYSYYSFQDQGEGLFYDCPIDSLYVGRNLSYSTFSSYGDSPFAYKTSLKQVVVGDSVTSIGSSAFKGCSSLSSITIPNSVTSIGSYAF